MPYPKRKTNFEKLVLIIQGVKMKNVIALSAVALVLAGCGAKEEAPVVEEAAPAAEAAPAVEPTPVAEVAPEAAPAAEAPAAQ